MKQLVCYSIWGNIPRYNIGLLRNIELCRQIYPGWTVRIYHNNTSKVVETLKDVELVDMSGSVIPGYFWRFLPNDADRFISRDTDSRVSMRERDAVDQWIESEKALHVMRDHPHHGKPMMAGMWGMKISRGFDMEKTLMTWLLQKKLLKQFVRNIDEDFLRDEVYPRFINDSIAHDSISRDFPNSKSFPSRMKDYRFVGEIIDEYEQPFPQWKYWINRKEL